MYIFKPIISRFFWVIVILATACPFVVISFGYKMQSDLTLFWFMPVAFISAFGAGALEGMTSFNIVTKNWSRFEIFNLLLMPTIIFIAGLGVGLLLFIEENQQYLEVIFVGAFFSLSVALGTYTSKKYPTIFMQKM